MARTFSQRYKSSSLSIRLSSYHKNVSRKLKFFHRKFASSSLCSWSHAKSVFSAALHLTLIIAEPRLERLANYELPGDD